MGCIVAFPWLQRLGFAGWFGALTWFGFLGAPAIFRAGVASVLAVLFPPLFWFGVGCGAAALIGTVGAGHGIRRLALAATILVGSLAEALVIDPIVHRATVGTSAFAAAHTASTLVALVMWLAAGWALLADG